MRHLISLCMAVSLLVGCGTLPKVPIDAKTAASLQDKSLVLTVRDKKPDFVAMTAGKASFAILGAFAMIAEGNEIVAKNNVADPAEEIGVAVAKALVEKRGVRYITPSVATSADAPAELATAVGNKARYALDMQTHGWNFAYFPTDWTHYRVAYSARARLIDLESKAVLAEGVCSRMPETNANAPTYDQLLANEAAFLKKELASSVSDCINLLKKDIFLIP